MKAGTDYVLETLLWCLLCRRPMRPDSTPGRDRRYSCGRDCPQPDLAATDIEQDMTLKAMVYGNTVLHPQSRGRTAIVPAGDLTGEGVPAVSPRERTRWLLCDATCHHAIVRAAYLRITIDAHGRAQPVWRHHTESPGPEPQAGPT